MADMDILDEENGAHGRYSVTVDGRAWTGRHVVLGDPTYNVAYWNLDSRPLVRVDGAVHVQDAGPLHFFHFSGYEPERPWVLSKYHVERPRVVLSEHPVVAELWETAEAERHVGAGHLLDRLGARPALPRPRAQDRLWLLMAPDSYHRLVGQRGWSGSAYERWLAEQIRALFP